MLVNYSQFSMAAGGAASVLQKASVMKRLPIAGLLLALVRGVAATQSGGPLVAFVALDSNDAECFPYAIG